MKHYSSVAIAVLLIFLLSVCGAEATTYKMKVHSVGADTHASSYALKDFKKYIEEKSKGQIQVLLYLNATLGGDRQAIEAMQLGTVEAGVVGSSILAVFEPKFNIFEFPFMFKDDVTAKRIIDGEIGEMLNKDIQKQDIRILGYGVNGFRHVTNNRGPIRKAEDMKGLKIRTMENPIHIATFKALGANPTPMNFGELYTALSQKTVDSMECPINLIYTPKFYEVQKYMSMTGHLYAIAPLTVSQIFFKKLSPDLQKIIIDAGKLYVEKQRKLTIQEENDMLALLKKSGMQVNDLTAAEKAALKKLCMPIYKQFESKVGSNMLKKVIDANK